MDRRLSTAAALALTTVTGFVITTYGMTSGLFGGNDGAEAQSQEQVEATVTAAPTAPPPAPQVVEQVVYQDEYVQVPATQSQAQGNAAPARSTKPAATAPPANNSTTPPPTPASTPKPPGDSGVQAVDIAGRVSDVSDGRFTVTGTRFGTAVITVDSSTRYAGFDGASFSDLEPGMKVEVKVLVSGGSTPTGADGTFIAVKVAMHPAGGDD